MLSINNILFFNYMMSVCGIYSVTRWEQVSTIWYLVSTLQLMYADRYLIDVFTTRYHKNYTIATKIICICYSLLL